MKTNSRLSLGASTARSASLALAALLFASPAFAHFSWIVPERSGARLFLSEVPKFDFKVDGGIVAPTSVSFKGTDGQARTLVLRKGVNDFLMDGPSQGTYFGNLDLGVTARGDVPNVLLYFPKAIAGDPLGKDAQTTGAPVELFVTGAVGAVKLKFLADGKPVPNAELTIILPDDTQKKVKTDGDGLSETLTLPGRYGVWGRHWVDSVGERNGAAYKQIRRYATLVFDSPARVSAAAATDGALSSRLPQATSSFGAAVDAGWLYVYGGHVTPTHDYSTASVSGAFNRLNLAKGTWEKLPEGPAVQGTNLAAHDGHIYRIGGMKPMNAPGQPSDTRSLSDASGFNPANGAWEPLPALPSGRSSHDVSVVGDELYVIGGWNMKGAEPSEWADTFQVLDLRAKPLKWQTFPQPFKRRAFVTAVRGNSIYVIGGLDPEGKVLDSVEVYDTVAETWGKAPVLPKGPRNGFSPAASVIDNRLYVSLGDGGLYRLDDIAGSWEKIATTTARIAHRMVPDGDHRLIVVGGASNGDNIDLMETVTLGPTTAIVASSKR